MVGKDDVAVSEAEAREESDATPAPRSPASRLEVARGLSYGTAIIALLMNLAIFVGLLETTVESARGQRDPRSRTLWDSVPHIEVNLSAGALAIVDPLVSTAVFVMAGLGLAKEWLLRGNRLALVLNIGHVTLCVGAFYVGLDILYWPFEIMLG